MKIDDWPVDLPEELRELWTLWREEHEPDKEAFETWLTSLMAYTVMRESL